MSSDMINGSRNVDLEIHQAEYHLNCESNKRTRSVELILIAVSFARRIYCSQGIDLKHPLRIQDFCRASKALIQKTISAVQNFG